MFERAKANGSIPIMGQERTARAGTVEMYLSPRAESRPMPLQRDGLGVDSSSYAIPDFIWIVGQATPLDSPQKNSNPHL